MPNHVVFKDEALGVFEVLEELGDLFVLRVCVCVRVCASVDRVSGVRDVLPDLLLLPLAA